MAEMRGAGLFIQRVAFDQRAEVEDEYGNMVAGWTEQFQARAHFEYLRGSETVMAGRLAGQEPMLVRIRTSANARRIENEWQMRDKGDNDKPYNVTDVTWDNSRAVIDLIVVGGVATG